MSTNKLKEELLSYIANTDDEDLLSLLKEDMIFYGKVKDADILDGLSQQQVSELKALSEEDSMKDVETFSEFKKATEQWRTK